MGFISRLFGPDDTLDFDSEQLGKADLSNRVKDSFDHLSLSTREQSSAVQQTMASLEEMRSMLAQTDEQVGRSQSFADKARETGSSRLQTVEKMQKTMGAMKETNLLLNELQDSFIAIKNKTRVINDIVFKTQLLSFNASIEAARAGHLGKGFSVVAEEVGRLAQTSGKAAKEIETLISDSQKKAMDVVIEVVSRAEEGAKVSNEVIVNFQELNQAINEISKSLRAIGEASKQQMQGMEQTTVAIDRINKLTEENRKNAEDVLHMAEKLLETKSSLEPAEVLKIVDNIASDVAKTEAAVEIKNMDADHSSFKPQS